jgi:predicted nucleic acid-binding protein
MPGVLIDTSAWIEAMRRGGDEGVRGRVHALVAEGRARFSDWVRLELWAGVGEAERRWLRQMESLVETAPTDAAVWDLARRLTGAARGQGHTFPASDLLVAACARANGLELYHRDAHFGKILEIAAETKA